MIWTGVLATVADNGGMQNVWQNLQDSQVTPLVLLLAILGLMPFVLTMVTSFAKLVIVGGILRQALGTQQVPPTTVITGLALILTIHIMWPVAEQVITNLNEVQAANEASAADGNGTGLDLERVAPAIAVPIRDFMEANSTERNKDLFRRLRAKAMEDRGGAAESAASGPVDAHLEAVRDGLTVLTPAFVLTELTEAFQIGFLIFVPFLVIDLVVSNVLLAMGMHMLSPTTISLPFKLLLFVLMDGWQLLIQGLVLGYQG